MTTAWRIALAVLLLVFQAAHAHKPSDSFLKLYFNGAVPTARWDIALRDLEYAIGLDGNGDGAITWGELRARHAHIAAYALARLSITAGGERCGLRPGEQRVERHTDGAYTVLYFALDCPAGAVPSVEYRLFFDLDPLHRGLLQVHYPDAATTAVLSPEQPRIVLDPAGSSRGREFADYWREGARHVWTGFDHLLFLIALLLPAVLRRDAHGWRQVEAFRLALVDLAGIVTAFTVAHSLTLGAAILGWVSLPARWTESAIAATVVLAALNNLYPLVRGRRWAIAFGLGLVHGFGFAGVLQDLGLPAGALALALAGFNLGVESGQLVVVAGFLPLAYAVRRTWFYRRAVLQLGSLAVAGIAFIWLLERSLELRLV